MILLAKKLSALILLACLTLYSHARQFERIEFEGLQRMSESVILNMMQLQVGQDIKRSDLSDAIKQLYRTGNFEDVKIGIKDDVLVISVIERPMIASVEFDGNSLLPKEALESALTGMGLTSGEILKRSTVAEIEAELAMQYQMQGRYNANITVDIKAKPQNRVDLFIEIDEGSTVKVEHIEIVGNHYFSDEKLLDYLDLKSLNNGGLKSWLNSADSFNEQVLRGSLEQLRSFYLDRGYLQFELDSVQPMLNDNKELATIAVNIQEGKQFYLQSIDVAGKLKGYDQSVDKLVKYESGELYSQKDIDRIIRRIQNLYDSKGYYYVQVNDAPVIDEEKQHVDVVLLIDPGVKDVCA